ncbi:MAG TPA: hypothetical protein VHZ51_25015 [Ktedonobacteraceae bacterium]|jgi:hypothetical protein|nr:hypothetical protein [Ktedonobacteraceae bacterium]
MNIQKLLLRLYPRAWRTRYEEEFLVVLASHPFSLFEGIDLIRGAFDAQLHPGLGTTGMPLPERTRQMLSTLRSSLLIMFCAYIGVILAGMGFQKLTESTILQGAIQAHGLVGLSFHLVIIGAVVALLAVLAGGVPIAFAVIRFALAQKRYGPLFLLAVPLLAFAIFLGTILLMKAIDHPGTQPVWLLFLDRGILFGTLIAVAIISAGAVCLAVVRSEIPEKFLRFAVLPSTLTTLSMALISAAIITWGLGLRYGAPQIFAGNDGIVGTSTIGTWLGIIAAMIIATALSTLSLLRGLSAHSTLDHVAR